MNGLSIKIKVFSEEESICTPLEDWRNEWLELNGGWCGVKLNLYI